MIVLHTFQQKSIVCTAAVFCQKNLFTCLLKQIQIEDKQLWTQSVCVCVICLYLYNTIVFFIWFFLCLHSSTLLRTYVLVCVRVIYLWNVGDVFPWKQTFSLFLIAVLSKQGSIWCVVCVSDVKFEPKSYAQFGSIQCLTACYFHWQWSLCSNHSRKHFMPFCGGK